MDKSVIVIRESPVATHGANTAIGTFGSPIAVAGGLGFVGSHVVAEAHSRGHAVVVLARDPRRRDLLESTGVLDAEIVACDISNADQLVESTMRIRPSIIINAAGSICRHREESTWSGCIAANVGTTAALIKAVMTHNQPYRPLVISLGSQAEYGAARPPWTEATLPEPTSPYGAAKAAATTLLCAATRADEFNATTLRLPLVFGPGQQPNMLVPTVICDSLLGRTTETTGGEQTRRFAYVRDIASDILDLAEHAQTGRIDPVINVSGYPPMTVAEMLREVRDRSTWPVNLKIGALPYRSKELLDAWADTSIADSMTSRDRTPLASAMHETTGWYRDNPWFWTGSA